MEAQIELMELQSQSENGRPSGLKQPSSRLPAATSTSMSRTLLETSQSELNARSRNGTMPPPSTLTKHKLNGLPEPAPKRKTLAERAGEPLNALRSHLPASSRPTAPRSDSMTVQVGARPATSHVPNGYRHASNVSTVSSTSATTRPQSRVNGVRTIGPGRPPSAADARTLFDEDAETGIMGKRKAWDIKGRLEDMEQSYSKLRSEFASADESKTMIEEKCEVYRTRAKELVHENKTKEAELSTLKTERKNISADLERARNDLHTTTIDLQQARRDHERDLQDLESKHARQLDELNNRQVLQCQELERELDKIADQGKRDIEDARRAWEKQRDAESAELTTQHWEEIEELNLRHEQEKDRLMAKIADLEQKSESRATETASEVQVLRDSLAGLQTQLDTAKELQTMLRSQISLAETRNASLEQEKLGLVSKTHFLEGNQEAQSLEFTSMSDRLQDAINSKESTLTLLRREEMLRRKLNATILELRGNIRVFIRTRPLLSGEEDPAKVDYPDAEELEGGKELVVQAPTTLSATGKERHEKHSYTFDRVFGPDTANPQVFEDCRELVQSVVDGYNVSILSYGQTGSGKTFGMSGPDGIIPCSISLLLSEMQRLREKGWEYHVDASFVEVYNETLNDLLGDAKTWDEAEDLNTSVRAKKKEKHEIHHDAITGKTSVTNLSAITLWPPPDNDGAWPPPAHVALHSDASIAASLYTEQAVKNLLETAAKNRRVASTKSNERSSRSHSVFILTLKGSCAATGESSEGVLNLVDLAGSERLKQSGAEGDRKKETQAINKSLSSLGDVIAALGNKKGDESHIPYRNSKLTYLLQSSLGGTAASGKSSRTLMMLHLSPLQAHWQESRSSLLFGSKVHGTHIGAARKR